MEQTVGKSHLEVLLLLAPAALKKLLPSEKLLCELFGRHVTWVMYRFRPAVPAGL